MSLLSTSSSDEKVFSNVISLESFYNIIFFMSIMLFIFVPVKTFYRTKTSLFL